MRWLRALDAATTAFVQQLWPIPDAVFEYAEPALTGDELVALRQLIEERFPASVAPVMPTGAATERPEVGSGVSPTPPTSGHPNIFIAAVYGLRDYVESQDCDAPSYWRDVADALELFGVSFEAEQRK